MMASETEATTPRTDHDEDVSMDSSSEDEAIPAMVVSRARRANAGNRMANLIALAEADDQEKLIYGDNTWDETVNDEEFGGAEAVAPDDVSLVSSSDDEGDEDEGDEEAGEKELKKQERTEKSKKRKLTDPFKQTRKKVKFDPFTVRHSAPKAPRPKRKSERDSWLPTSEDVATRASKRTLAKKNKADVHARLAEKEKAREKLVADMAAANKRKEDAKLKPLSQEEKMAMAAKIEKENSKSLNRWEEAEERRAAEQQARLDALRNRTLEGPFIRYWSGPALWKDERIVVTGKKALLIQEIPDEGIDMTEPPTVRDPARPDDQLVDTGPPLPKTSALYQGTPSEVLPASTVHEDQSNAQSMDLLPPIPWASQAAHSQIDPSHMSQSQVSIPTLPRADVVSTTGPTNQLLTSTPDNGNVTAPQDPVGSEERLQPEPRLSSPSLMPSIPQVVPPTSTTDAPATPASSSIMFAPPATDGGFLSGILDWASVQPPPAAQQHGPADANIVATPAPNPSSSHAQTNFSPAMTPFSTFPLAPFPPGASPHGAAVPMAPPPPKPKPVLRIAARTLIALENFEEISPTAKSEVAPVLLAPVAKTTRYLTTRAKNTAPPVVLCAITGTPARYRDPMTGLPYRDGYAFKCLRRLVSGSCEWSAELGCFVGARMGANGEGGARPARGVPERFWKRASEISPRAEEGKGKEKAVEPADGDVKMEDATVPEAPVT